MGGYVVTVEVTRANGLEIAYRRVGEGPPLVFVHGAAEDGRVWQPQLARLADEFTVVAWDGPGAGGSSDLPAVFGLADYAHCLAALIEALALGPAHVAGLSWGGTVVQELYRRHPELVATLILARCAAARCWRRRRSPRSVSAPGRSPPVAFGIAHQTSANAAPRSLSRIDGSVSHGSIVSYSLRPADSVKASQPAAA